MMMRDIQAARSIAQASTQVSKGTMLKTRPAGSIKQASN